MKHTIIKKIGLGSAAMLLGGALVSAQNVQQQQPSQSSQSQSQERSKQELKVSQQELHQQVTDVNKASKLIGMKVKNKENQNLGKISDIVIDLQSGKVAYAAMSIGGVLGVGGKLVAVPLEAFTPDQGQEGLIVNLSHQQLQQAPGFSQNNWPDLNAAQSGKTIGVASQSTGASGSSSQQQSGSQQSGQQQQDKSQDNEEQEKQQQDKSPDQQQSPQ